ncbi:MAG TPA: hypothetical protein VND64_01635 [Pirellulales bacterium]|nr:hypothetical protein [Pirellulales bacterium]
MPARRVLSLWLCALVCLGRLPPTTHAAAAEPEAKVYVVLWFDTEDYLLPASDDAALRVAEFLTGEGIKATFKVVGKKARTLKRRGRDDVIAALARHEIGYHSNYHSVQPTPALYLAPLGWDDGVAEFDRRERAGFDDVGRIFGQQPTCYGQPGSSWAPQSYGALRLWDVGVYLDAGNHLRLDDRPHYYCGVLTLYKLAHTLRTGLAGDHELRAAEDRFQQARQALLDEGGGVVSIFYHPCEFVHKEFWDGVNFRDGANPPRETWKLPPAKSPEESAVAYRTFESYIRFIHGFPGVRFITAREAAKLYRDRARGRSFSADELRTIATRAADGVTFQRRDDDALSAAEAFWLVHEWLARKLTQVPAESLTLTSSPLGPTSAAPAMAEIVTADWSQFERTVADVSDALARQRRIPSAVWLGSAVVTPESYYVSAARVAADLLAGRPAPAMVEFRPAALEAARYVADDGPELWGWVIFPRNHRAPAMMELAKRQAWTIKPALIDRDMAE